MINILKKIIFLLERPPVVLIAGKEYDSVSKMLSEVLKDFKLKKVSNGSLPWALDKKEIIVFEMESVDPHLLCSFQFFLKRSRKPILVVNHLGNIPPDKLFFSGEKKKTFPLRKIAEVLPAHGFVVSNHDDEAVSEIENETIAKVLTFGFQKRSVIQATDVNVSIEGVNFKVNYEGHTIPFWLEKIFGKAHIYQALAVVGVASALDINLIDVSQALRDYKPPKGRMRLIKGIKNALILDDAKEATLFSMMEALDIMKEIGKGKRKIAVLGDILELGRFTPDLHEDIGEKVAETADIFFAVGLRAAFMAKGAKRRGMKEVFEFETTEEAKKEIQKEMREGDLILIDASREMKMEEIVEEIIDKR